MAQIESRRTPLFSNSDSQLATMAMILVRSDSISERNEPVLGKHMRDLKIHQGHIGQRLLRLWLQSMTTAL